MPPEIDAEERWRALAAETRNLAETMADSQSRMIMLSIASAYDRLAERARARKNRGKEP